MRELNEPTCWNKRRRRESFLGWLVVIILILAGVYAPWAWSQSQGGGTPGGFGLNVRNFGAVGDCRHDDTAAIQAAVNQISGRTLFLPHGCYLLTKPIEIPFSVGWRIEGEGERGTILRQKRDNMPILLFTKEQTQEWEISDIEFAWQNRQPNQNKDAVAILFAPDTTSKGGFYNFTIDHVTFDNGYRGIYLEPAPKGALPVWGFDIEDVIGGHEMSGSTIDLAPSPSVGQPRCMLKDIYSSQAISEPQVILRNCTSGTVDDIEDNNGLDTSLDLTSDAGLDVRGLHFEMHRMVHPKRPVIAAENSDLSIEGVSAYIWSSAPGKYFLIRNVAGGGQLSLKNISLTGTSPLNDRPGVVNSPEAKSYVLWLSGTVKLTELQGLTLRDAAVYAPEDIPTAQKVLAIYPSQR